MQITTQLREFIITNYYIPSETNLDSVKSFLGSGIIDSTGVLELVSFVESKFGISISDEDLVPSNFDSLDALTTFVEFKVQHS
jgi:acyl carrier protein